MMRRSRLAAAALLAALAALELAVRFGWPPPPHGGAPDWLGREAAALQPAIAFKADAKVLWLPDAAASAPGSGLHRGGLCGREPPTSEKGAHLRIGLLGDGLLFRASAPDGESIALVLERLLERAFGPRAVEVYDLAVPGFTPAQGAALAERALPLYDLDLVLVHFGPANAVETAHRAQPDERWLEQNRAARRRTPLRLLDAALAAGTGLFSRAPASGEPEEVRCNSTRYFDQLADLLADLRELGTVPVVIEPVQPERRPGREKQRVIAEIFATAARTVANAAGTPYTAVQRELDADAGAFEADGEHLSVRGRRLVARGLFRTLVRDPAFVLFFLDWLDRAPSDPARAYLAGSFGLLQTIDRGGPAAPPKDAVAPLLSRALDAAPAGAGADAALRLALARWSAADLEGTFRVLVDAEARGADPALSAALAAVASVLLGRVADVAGALDAAPAGAAAEFARGLAAFSSDLTAARGHFELAAALDPTFGAADLWRARCWLQADDAWRARAWYRVGIAALSNGAGTEGLRLPAGDTAGEVALFLQTEPLLFGESMRDGLGRFLFRSWLEAPAARDDAFARLDRADRLRQDGLIEDADVELAAAQALVPNEAAALLAVGRRLAAGGHREAARALLERAIAAGSGGEAELALGVVELQEDRLDAAAALLRAALERLPEDPRCLYYLGDCEYRRGDFAAAAAALKQALRAWPEHRPLVELSRKVEQALAEVEPKSGSGE